MDSASKAPGDTARLYHRLTSFTYVPEDQWPTPARPAPASHPLVLQGFVALDPTRVPAPCKAYQEVLPDIRLPRDWPRLEVTATSVLAGQAPRGQQPAGLDLAGLARLLHLSAGVVRASERAGRRWLFRASGSAGGLFPLEVYVSARGVVDLADGIYWFDPVEHTLLMVGPAAGGETTTLVVTGVPWRTGWKYAERGLRHIYWDTGTMLAQTLALADSAGLRPRLWTEFPDAHVAHLVGADGVDEFPVAIVGLGDGEPAIRASGHAAAGEIDDDPTEFPLVTLAHHAGDTDRLGDAWPSLPPMPGPPPGSADLDDVVLRRSSARMMDPSAAVSPGAFDWSLGVSLRDTRIPHFIAVHAVDGLEPGLYRWPDLDQPVRRGPLREELWRACWYQDLGRDAAFVVMAAADLVALDDRGYRVAQLEAGIVNGRLHLAAYALGIGASGMTFLDSEIEGLLGEPLAGLLFTCVGKPTYRHKPGGPPGKPTEVVIPSPREPARVLHRVRTKRRGDD